MLYREIIAVCSEIYLFIRLTLIKTNRRPLYVKTQSVPRCKHFISAIKTNQFML